MATVLFINRTDLVRNSILDGNVDTDKFIFFIKTAQEIHIQNYLSTDMYNGLTAAENADTVSKDEVDYLVEKARTNAEWYTRRFINFMSFNQTTYPEYTSNTNDDIYPSYDATFNGWVL